jgi:hypothetical protein
MNAPAGRWHHTAIWTGSEMTIWGGRDENFTYLNTGGRYHPGNDNWTATSIVNAPSPRESHTAIWADGEMIVWGGYPEGNYPNAGERCWTQIEPPTSPPTPSPTPSPIPTPPIPATGGRYDPSTDNWTATSTTNAPDIRSGHTAIWTGSEMIVWGGTRLNDGGRYCVEPGPTPTATPTATPTETCVVLSAPCGTFFFPPPTDFTVGVSCPVDPFGGCGAGAFTVNNVPADSCTVSDLVMITFHFNASPVVPGPNTMHIQAGAVSCCLRAVAEFTCTFRYEGPTPSPTPTSSSTPRPTPPPRPRPTPHPRP